MNKIHLTVFEKIGKVCKIDKFLPIFTQFAHLWRFNQNGLLAGERGYDEPSFGAIRKKFHQTVFQKIGKVCKIGEFLPNLPTFGQFNHNGALAGESGRDEYSFGAIKRKFIKQFLRK